MDNQTQPKVFVAQYVRNLDYAEAEKFGKVEFLTSNEYRPEPTVQRFNDEVVQDIKRGMSVYMQGVDYIMTTGSSLPNVIIGSLLGKGEHKVLKWSNHRRTYEIFSLRV